MTWLKLTKPNLFVLALCITDATEAATLADHAWHDRVLLVFAASDAAPLLAVQRAHIDQAQYDFADRDLRAILVVGNSVKGSTDKAIDLRQRFHVSPDAFRVLLIGKDGGVKLESSEPVASKKLNATIDAMPMRREELRGRN